MALYRLLVVDDEPMVLDVIRKSYRNEKDYQVVTATSGAEAIRKLKSDDYHLVLSDHIMPGITGMELLKYVKSEHPDVITILFTAYADLDMVMEAINSAGVYKFLTKPLNIVELKLTIKRALELQQLVKERNQLADKVRGYEAQFRLLEKKHPGITHVDRDKDGNVILDLD